MDGGTADLLGEVGSLGGEKLGGEIVRCVVIVCGAALTGFAIFELGVGWEESLMVRGSCEGLLASSLVNETLV